MNVRSASSCFRAIGLALALAVVPLIGHASKLPDFKQTGATVTGNSAKIGMTGNGGPAWGSTIPISPVVGGWTYAGNYGVPQQAKGTTMNMSASGDVFFSGTKYPFQAGYTVPASNVFSGLSSAAQAVGAMAGGPAGLALIVAGTAAPYIKQWFDESGLRVDPTDQAKIQKGDPYYCGTSPCYEYNGNSYALSWRANPETACKEWVTYYQNQYTYVETQNWGSGNYGCVRKDKATGVVSGFTLGRRTRAVDATRAWWNMPSMSDIAPYMQATPFDPRVVPEILAQGGDIPMPAPTITGPASLPGPLETIRNSDGTTTTRQTTNNYQISGDTITNITNVTSTTNYNSSSTIISTSTTTITPQTTDQQTDVCKTNPGSVMCASKTYLDDMLTKLDKLIAKADPQTDCDKKPNSVGCQDMGTPAPSDTLQKESRAVTITPATFSGGSCPSPVAFSVFNRSYSFSYETLCGKLAALSSLFLALAGLTAAWIFTSGFRV